VASPLDEDDEHATYDAGQVKTYFAAATQAALALAALRAPYRGRVSQVNAWWGTFDLDVSLFSGRAVDPPSDDFIMRNSANARQIEIGWWPGDHRYPRAAFFGFAFPPPDGIETAVVLSPPAGRRDSELGEYLLDWADVRATADPRRTAINFGLSVIGHACQSLWLGSDPGRKRLGHAVAGYLTQASDLAATATATPALLTAA
jgi:Family of unknown function (DUF5996)